jgi:hypothetical protein
MVQVSFLLIGWSGEVLSKSSSLRLINEENQYGTGLLEKNPVYWFYETLPFPAG